ncbi:hypothetical protein TELCIR_10578 [Teladorsagia circumcincta]|uniref:Protein kinase domain-containing protein n=1 Tax=Teladorsagia circumcincta TaxID=45464 RepID=A0A2G9UBR6_TELCI|nr:hypothetical protein TELCIR_10578 [Teladorsagia circumcincta]
MTKRPSLGDLDSVQPPAKAPCIDENENDDHPKPLPASIISTLIAQIQHHPCIWDHDHEFFGRREQIDSAWRSIAEQTDVKEALQESDRFARKFRGHAMILSGADLLTEENVIIRKTLLKDQEQTAQVYHNLKWGRLLPHPNILSVLDAFEAGDSLYTVTDMMDGRLADIVDENLNHFVIAKIVYQLLSALEPLHSNGLYHGVRNFAFEVSPPNEAICWSLTDACGRVAYQNITLNSVFINTDAVLKLSSYGDVMQSASEEKTREDIMSVGSILARLLLEEESFLKLSKIKSHNDLDWRTILQGNTESGLIDFHARNILYLLLGARCSLSDLLRHPYLFTFRKNVGNVPLINAEHHDLSSLSLSDVQGLLRDELNRYESPISIQDVQ